LLIADRPTGLEGLTAGLADAAVVLDGGVVELRASVGVKEPNRVRVVAKGELNPDPCGEMEAQDARGLMDLCDAKGEIMGAAATDALTDGHRCFGVTASTGRGE
jgi:hypothetical protein